MVSFDTRCGVRNYICCAAKWSALALSPAPCYPELLATGEGNVKVCLAHVVWEMLKCVKGNVEVCLAHVVWGVAPQC